MSRDINDCKGARHRGVNEQEATSVPGRLLCVELGTRTICPSCFAPTKDLAVHQSRHCGEYNAHVKIHNGYHRQYSEGRAGNLISPYHLSGEMYRLVRNTFALPAFWIVRQEEGWGPYDPIIIPQGIQRPAWSPNPGDNVSYHDLVERVVTQSPPTFAVAPRRDHREVALSLALSRPTDRSLIHETHKADEQADMRAIASFIDAHPEIRQFIEGHAAYNCPDWDK